MPPGRILIAIPHYFKESGDPRYGSGSSRPEARLNALARCIAGLRQNFGRRQGVLQVGDRQARRANEAFAHDVDIVICTTSGHHLLDKFPHDPPLFRHRETAAEPMRLVYECHRVLREAAGRYDLYGYMEDDLVIHDPLFLDKIAAVTRIFGPRALLQPNRFEVALGAVFDKFYVDGDLRREVVERFVDFNDGAPADIELSAFGRPMRLTRTLNPHSGCFFLNGEQLRLWAERPEVQRGDDTFIGPLESAATLGLMRAFAVYKPHMTNAGMLDIEHCGTRFLSLVGRSIPLAVETPA